MCTGGEGAAVACPSCRGRSSAVSHGTQQQTTDIVYRVWLSCCWLDGWLGGEGAAAAGTAC